MMTCRELTEFLSDYISDDLPEPVSREFSLHVKLCRDCKVFLNQFRNTVAAGRSCEDKRETPIPEDLVRAIMKAVSANRSTP